MTESNEPSLIEGKVFLTTILFLGALIFVAGFASYYIPAGTFEEVAKQGKQIKVYKAAQATPIPIWKIALSPILCLTGKNGPKIIVLILFILLIGGSFSIMNKSGALPAILAKFATQFADKKTLFLCMNVGVFMLLGASLGIMEEIVPMILFFVPIAYRMGWDSVTGLAIPFLSAGFGFAAAMFNPFTVGTAQKLAELPLFSGLWLRALFFAITLLMVLGYLLYYTRKIEKDPTKSPTYELDQKRKLQSTEGQDIEEVANPGKITVYLLVCFALVAGVVFGGTQISILQELAFPIIALIFLIMGFGVGLLAQIGIGQTFKHFLKGLADFAPAIVLILMAASVGYMIEIGNVMPTILHKTSQYVGGMGKGPAIVIIYGFQMLLNLFVPSGTGQAVLTIPILAPLGDIVGISRQSIVLAYQFGDGFSNLLWPTNPMLLIALGLAGVSYKQWLKWVLPLQLCLMAVSVGFLLLAVSIGYA
ncbi:MAG: hypothetical protein CL920_25755 [Deltaproteobacteria bacterium]|nr:hypothetical protein [Deltaproteobacteria bacterium]MBU52113.1 hypothetical protein [Deltaproteobacteria bacterium]|tara:strand:+ start:13035 stop:14465 length:1431 start_codon:yes stop_codon:yes gene_type:complete